MFVQICTVTKLWFQFPNHIPKFLFSKKYCNLKLVCICCCCQFIITKRHDFWYGQSRFIVEAWPLLWNHSKGLTFTMNSRNLYHQVHKEYSLFVLNYLVFNLIIIDVPYEIDFQRFDLFTLSCLLFFICLLIFVIVMQYLWARNLIHNTKAGSFLSVDYGFLNSYSNTC